ncbi:MAG: hypothetical protein VYC82_00950 [Verrucomicrobiota bacterium]|nr:hypothetical protein [Verrucomicrobiota bacterium]
METRKSDTPVIDQDRIRVKIVVDDAARAVSTIREKFGEDSKVVSVKQQDAAGLTGFLKKPRLEIIVEAPNPKISNAAPENEEAISDRPNTVGEGVARGNENSGVALNAGVVTKAYQQSDGRVSEESEDGYFSGIDDHGDASSSSRVGTAANPVRRGTLEYVERAVSMLKALGFDDSLIERIRYDLDFRSMGELPVMEIYNRICDWLRNQFPIGDSELQGDCRAFVGGCGVGKTTALCKALSAEVFVKDREPVVLKLDGSLPNSSDGLEAFCEVVGVPLIRSMDEIEERSVDRPIFIDVPGVNLADSIALENCKRDLDSSGADDRILVINAAYEAEAIEESIVAGAKLGANHVIFTHLDETRRVGKLWRFALNAKMKPIFFSFGANPAGDYTMSPLSYLLEKTFPQGRNLAKADKRVETGVHESIEIGKAVASV